MMKTNFSKTTLLIVAMLMAIFSACTNHSPANNDSIKESMWGNDPKNAEKVYSLPQKSANQDFEIASYKNPDGSITYHISHSTFAMTEFYSLYSPAGNLRLMAAGPSEMADVYSYLISYNSKGQIDSISVLKTLGDMVADGMSKLTVKSAHDLFQQWIQNKNSIQYSYPVLRDSIGKVVAIGNVAIRDNYKTKLYIKEWGPFWTSDISGGMLGIFVLQEYQGDKNGSYVNYLYQGDHLVAELAYWKGTFIKARTYNHDGSMVHQYNDRNINVEDLTFQDWEEETKWYVN
ncbi:hypothetical protein [Segatella hominis]|uniref:hypothetical protein n=1 Tax=Segatella hominis TaxID=2518605 RepID=UPI003AB963C7